MPTCQTRVYRHVGYLSENRDWETYCGVTAVGWVVVEGKEADHCLYHLRELAGRRHCAYLYKDNKGRKDRK